MMISDLETAVDRIFDHLRVCGSMMADRRRPGANPADVEAKLRALGLRPPDDLIRLYAYCDGTTTTPGKLGKISFFPGYYWMGVDEAIAEYRVISEYGGWHSSWFPIFANGGGDFYAVICDTASPYFGEVLGFMLGTDDDHIVEFQSVPAMFKTIERCFAQKAYFCFSGYLKEDILQAMAIARTVQPDFTEHDL